MYNISDIAWHIRKFLHKLRKVNFQFSAFCIGVTQVTFIEMGKTTRGRDFGRVEIKVQLEI